MPDSTDPETLELAAQLRSTVVPLARRFRQEVDHWLTPTQQSVLGSVNRHGPIVMRDLATREHLSPSMITRVALALEEARLVTREVDTADRRLIYIRITPEGERWIEDVRAEGDTSIARNLRELDKSDLDALRAALPAIAALVESPRGSRP